LGVIIERSVLVPGTVVQFRTVKPIGQIHFDRLEKTKGSMLERVKLNLKNPKILTKTVLVILIASAILIVGLTGHKVVQAAGATSSLNNVQIIVQSDSSNLTSYSLTVYNSSGYAVASSDSSFPAFGVELPAGNYLFTVLATQSYPIAYAGGSSVVATASSGGAAPTPDLKTPPILEKSPAIEYGYRMQQITGAQVLNIKTSELSNISTTSLSVHVAYANGTAAAGVSVQSSIVGEWYWYGGGINELVMWNQTDSAGSATLMVPDLPIEVNAWTWIPVDLPKNLTTVQRNVGGEIVNVTVYWQPTYVGLAGSSLVMPPSTTASITLHVQQPNYWVVPYGVRSAGVPSSSGAATAASSSTGVPASQQYSTPIPGNQFSGPTGQQIPAPSQIPPLSEITKTTQTIESSSPLVQAVSIAVVLAVALSAVSLVIALRKR